MDHALQAHRVGFALGQSIREQGEGVQRLAQVVTGGGQEPGFGLAGDFKLSIFPLQLGGGLFNARLQRVLAAKQGAGGLVEAALQPPHLSSAFDAHAGFFARTQAVHRLTQGANWGGDVARRPPPRQRHGQQTRGQHQGHGHTDGLARRRNRLQVDLDHHLAQGDAVVADHRQHTAQCWSPFNGGGGAARLGQNFAVFRPNLHPPHMGLHAAQLRRLHQRTSVCFGQRPHRLVGHLQAHGLGVGAHQVGDAGQVLARQHGGGNQRGERCGQQSQQGQLLRKRAAQQEIEQTREPSHGMLWCGWRA